MSTVPVTIVSNASNVGFPAAINQGLQYARGEYLVMLNNDVVVTDGWLEQLIGLASVSTAGKHEIRSSNPEMANSNSGPRESHPYPGRNITVLDLASESQETDGRAGHQGETIGLAGPM